MYPMVPDEFLNVRQAMYHLLMQNLLPFDHASLEGAISIDPRLTLYSSSKGCQRFSEVPVTRTPFLDVSPLADFG